MSAIPDEIMREARSIADQQWLSSIEKSRLSKAVARALMDRDKRAAEIARNHVLIRLAVAKTALDEIGGLSRALRQGGPDPMDLEGLSDALSRAVDLANATLTALEGQP